MISASARPCVALRVLTIWRQDVTSVVLRSVSRIAFMSRGWGDAIHSYMVVSVMRSRLISLSLGLGVPLIWRGVPIEHGQYDLNSLSFPKGQHTACMASLQHV